MIAYQTAPWHELFASVTGAAAALAGLIFVAVALNYDDIVNHPRLPSVAVRSLAVLIALVLLSIFMLTPGQSVTTVGIEIAVLGLGLSAGVLLACILRFDEDVQTSWKVRDITVSSFATIPMAVAGLSLTAHAGGGLYWAMAETVCGFVAAVYYAWILLIEIKR